MGNLSHEEPHLNPCDVLNFPSPKVKQSQTHAEENTLPKNTDALLKKS